MTAEIDLALALVERTWALWRARWRTASSCTSAVRAANHNIRKCSGWRPSPTASSWRWNMRGATWRSRSASRNWPRRLLSPRQFSRVFTAETGQSPAKAVERLRLEAARLMIEGSRHPLEVVARETGFRDRRHMREAFLRGLACRRRRCGARRGRCPDATPGPPRTGAPFPETGRIQPHAPSSTTPRRPAGRAHRPGHPRRANAGTHAGGAPHRGRPADPDCRPCLPASPRHASITGGPAAPDSAETARGGVRLPSRRLPLLSWIYFVFFVQT